MVLKKIKDFGVTTIAAASAATSKLKIPHYMVKILKSGMVFKKIHNHDFGHNIKVFGVTKTVAASATSAHNTGDCDKTTTAI